ncbi:hypothetical protein E2I00_003948 [Balaenoptera physalus]|uniref:S-formylglutathione hydrolase n=1 Tax=Balaenoptera physalus TaxID=9770 RepID=A0A6A1Q1F9_BALPH|nr:hypothetical protein E2I00_003948 [Balaenoptera physalus]
MRLIFTNRRRMALKQISSNKCFGGLQKVFEHDRSQRYHEITIFLIFRFNLHRTKFYIKIWLPSSCLGTWPCRHCSRYQPSVNHCKTVNMELPQLIHTNFPVDPKRMSIFGHSMGGHGALICALKNPGKYKAYDATHLVKSYPDTQLDILIDQGKDDQFLSDGQLLPDNFIAACTEKKIPVVFRLQEAKFEKLPLGYDHSYYFIATFITDHIRHHARYLNA